MRKLIFLFCILVTSLNAQFTDMNWAFGDSCGIKFSSTGIDSIYRTSVNARGTCASISDSVGNLLFYCSSSDPIEYLLGGLGSYKLGIIHNKNNVKMENGDKLKTSGWYKEMTILPWPDSATKFLVLLSGETPTTNPGLRYAKVDLSYNNGLGKVTDKNIDIDTGQIADGATSIRHANGRDWWVIYRKWGYANNKFFRFLLTPNGISTIQTQQIGQSLNAGFSRIVFNKSGDKMMAFSNFGNLELYEFDRCTGLLSNRKLIHQYFVSIIPEWTLWDGAFSPSGRYFYATTQETPAYLYQFDLTAFPIINGKTTIDTSSFPPYAASAIKLAPDGKIYRSTAWYDGLNWNYPYPDTTYNIVNTHLSVINSPDSLGLACDYQPYSLYLNGTRTYYGLPNNPDYTLGAVIGSPCDTLSVGIKEVVPKGNMYVYYETSSQKIIINANGLLGKKGKLIVYDLTGRVISIVDLNTISNEFRYEIPLEGLATGLYLISLETLSEKLVKRIVKN